MAASVNKVALPANSRLQGYIAAGDFIDCYAVASALDARAAADIALNFPAWTRGLLALRNTLVAPFGLATDGSATQGLATEGATTGESESVEQIGLFPIDPTPAENTAPDELLVGFNDKHLNFRISILATGHQVHLATWVHPHNLGGHLYLGLVMPFHIVIVRDALQRVAAAG
ncbi:MAG: DUF2867 domain-containing protein [Pseudomonadota bacterium]